MKYAFIRNHQTSFRITAMCQALQVSRSGYYDWRDRPECARVCEDRHLLAHVRRIHLQNRQTYGARKTWRALKNEGIACGRDRVARLRRAHAIEARRQRRFRITTEHHKSAPPAPDLLERRFHAPEPNQIWVGDITFIRTRQGWLFLAVLVDLFSRRIVGWAMAARATEALALSALEMALQQREPDAGVIHHTDRGAQYAATGYRSRLTEAGIKPSMNRGKNPRDNAVAESFFSNLKNELVHHCDFRTHDEARAAIFDYMELFYNRKRIHQTLGDKTPEQFEREWRDA
ncbi:MAG: IS3 family transposase [Usitatibacteraceae bacterium]